MKEESATISLHLFRAQKNLKTGKGPITVPVLLKLVQSFEETGTVEVCAR